MLAHGLTAVLLVVGGASCDGVPPPESSTGMAPPRAEAAKAILERVGVNAAAAVAFSPVSVRQDSRAFKAPNAAHAFQALFGTTGVEIQLDSGARLRFNLEAWGRDGADQRLAEVAPRLRDRRIEYSRDDAGIREWYVNGPEGLEQGFTLARSPGGSGVVTLRVRVSGHAGASPDPDSPGDLLLASVGDDNPLRYGGLLVTDAAGVALPAALQASGTFIDIRIDDGAARYPLHVDPFLWSSRQTLARSGAVGSPSQLQPRSLGTAAGAVALGFQGAQVDLFERNTGILATLLGASWTLSQTLTPAPGVPTQAFGRAVAMNAQTLIVGAGSETPNPDGPFPRGYADVFVRTPGSAWTLQTHLEPVASNAPAPCGESSFGSDVALDGTFVAVGANRMSLTGSCGQGRVFVFERSGTSWAQTQALDPPAVHPASPPAGYPLFFDTNYASAVALVGNTMAVGQPGRSLAPPLAGAVYVYARSSASAPFALQQALVSPDVTPGVTYNVSDDFGSEVELMRDGVGDVLIARTRTTVFAFRRIGTTWTSWWQDAAPSVSPRRNSAVLEHGRLYLGGSQDDVGAFTDAGRLRIYDQTGTGFTLTTSLNPRAPANNLFFGQLVAKQGSTLVGSHINGADVFQNLPRIFIRWPVRW